MKSNYKVAFDKGVALTGDNIQLDKQSPARPGFFEKRRMKKAVQHFEEASALEPGNAAPMLLIAKIRQRLDDLKAAWCG